MKNTFILWLGIISSMHTIMKGSQQAQQELARAQEAITAENYTQAYDILVHASSLCTDDLQTSFARAVNLIAIGAFKESITVFNRILLNHPHNINVLYNIGYALKSGGWIDEAIPYYQQVLSLEPDNDAAHLALGFAYLNKGDFAHGWPQHERYLKKSGKYAPELRALLTNNTLAGKCILLRPEGGLGDTINFIQCAQVLRNQGAQVIALVQKPLFKLLQSCDCVDEVIMSLPTKTHYDASVSYMSLPAALYVDETTMPKRTPYLYANPQLVDFRKTKLTEQENACHAEKTEAQGQACHAEAPLLQRRVGVCWEADLFHDESRLPVARRSIPLALLAQLANIPGVTLYSLQTDEHNATCNAPAIAGRIKTFDYPIDTEHGAFMDTAALIANMELVISVDTATAHLAAALGKPTWLLLPYTTDWRWIVGRTDSPWHPTMRIFKQPAPFDWQSVINNITQTLTQESTSTLTH